MPTNKKLLILAGDGIGPEVMAQVKRVLAWFGKNQALSFDTEDELVGGCSIDKHGVPLTDASSLKRELVAGLDIMILRELTGGVYFGSPRGIDTLPNGERRGINTQVYTTSEIVRVAKVAFELAQKRNKKLCSVEKANVMESGVLWREEVTKLAPQYKDVALSHMYADNCAMQLVRQPKQFDVIVTDNLF